MSSSWLEKVVMASFLCHLEQSGQLAVSEWHVSPGVTAEGTDTVAQGGKRLVDRSELLDPLLTHCRMCSPLFGPGKIDEVEFGPTRDAFRVGILWGLRDLTTQGALRTRTKGTRRGPRGATII